jgi:hypothetical protein
VAVSGAVVVSCIIIYVLVDNICVGCWLKKAPAVNLSKEKKKKKHLSSYLFVRALCAAGDDTDDDNAAAHVVAVG